MKPILYIFALLLSTQIAHSKLAPEVRESIYTDLQAPTLVHLKNGRTLPGHSIDVCENQIQVATAEGAGEIIYTFQTEEISTFTVAGESYKTLAIEWIESGENENALELMSMLFSQRVNILPFLPPSESHFFIYYVELILDSPKPARAIAIADILKPQIDNSAALNALEDAILDSYNALQLYDTVRPLAEEWVTTRTPYGSSALGYYALGAVHLRSEEYTTALDLALQPIVFATPTPSEKLAHCYAVAISAALGLREKDYALTLYTEMQELKLPWPQDDPTFIDPFKKLLKLQNHL